MWLGLDVGSDIALANAMAREIIVSGLANEWFIQHATSGFEAYRDCVEKYTLERTERETGVPAEVIRQAAHTYAWAKRAQICGRSASPNITTLWTTLSPLSTSPSSPVTWAATAVVSTRCAAKLCTTSGGGDMGAIPDRLPGFQHVENGELRAKFERAWGVRIEPKRGWHLSAMFEAMERGELTVLYVLGENPADSEADRHRALKLLGGLEFLVVQDLFYTRTAAMAEVVLPAAACAGAKPRAQSPPASAACSSVRRAVPPASRHATISRSSTSWLGVSAMIGALPKLGMHLGRSAPA